MLIEAIVNQLWICRQSAAGNIMMLYVQHSLVRLISIKTFDLIEKVLN